MERERASESKSAASERISKHQCTSYTSTTAHTTTTPPAQPSQHPKHHTYTPHNGARHLLGRAPPVHQLGCAPQARHPLEFGHWQLRPSDCGMLGLRNEKLEYMARGRNAEQICLHRPSSIRSANASATTTDCKSLSHTMVSATTLGHWTVGNRIKKEDICSQTRRGTSRKRAK